MRSTDLQRWGGIALVIAALGTVFAIAHHPTGAHSGGLGGIVHGAMILFLAMNAFGFAAMAAIRGIRRPLMLAGLIVYADSVFGHFGAATINGFIVPALAARGDGAVSHDLFLFAWESNQALAGLGVLANGLAFLLWSLDFLRDRSGESRAMGAAGLIAGALPAVLLFSGTIRMNVAGAFLSYALLAAWGLWVGVALLRNRIAPAQASASAE